MTSLKFPYKRRVNLIHFFQIVSLTELMAGVKAPSKTCQLFQLMCWPKGHKVPTSTNALVTFKIILLLDHL